MQDSQSTHPSSQPSLHRIVSGFASRGRAGAALAAIFSVVLLVSAAIAPARAATVKVLAHSTSAPKGGLLFDPSGNLYGTTYNGGVYKAGSIFRLKPGTDGKWTMRTLHSFQPQNGEYPQAALVQDSAGNLYGTTVLGGVVKQCGYGCGTVFELSPGANDTWTLKTIYRFHGKDGSNPMASLLFDASGNLYGTTSQGGAYGVGTAFELMPGNGGVWTHSILHQFNNQVGDGAEPQSALIFDGSGNLYGTTMAGGHAGHGTVFELAPGQNGKWAEKLIYLFQGENHGDGGHPVAGLTFDASGNLYGTTIAGGTAKLGTVFELTPASNGKWTEQVLYNFNGADGSTPYSGVVFDSVGNLYGTTFRGGEDKQLYGVLFELQPGSGGSWTESLIEEFPGNGAGVNPYGTLIFDSAGNLYGTTTSGGGKNSIGTVFEVTP